MELYNKVRQPPKEAIKEIGAGRLRGKSDINPMWRIKALTENFGMVGFGWKYEILEQRLEKGGNDEIAAFVRINLYVKVDDVWSDAIVGTGGSSFVAKEKNGLYTSDECFKMALTDAISVSCKALGFGADVYWSADKTKYTKDDVDEKLITPEQLTRLHAISKGQTEIAKKVLSEFGYKSSKFIKKDDYDEICKQIELEVIQ